MQRTSIWLCVCVPATCVYVCESAFNICEYESK